MCSVVGYIGSNMCRSFVMQGLARLEYRGYDSAGFACLEPMNHQLLYAKSDGELHNLEKKLSESPLDGHLGIGHTRWSTHGKVSLENAHPQFDCQKSLSIVHNGIIENHLELKDDLLQAGHIFHSETDTEIIAHLFEKSLAFHKTFLAALIDLVNQLQGAYAFIAIMQKFPDQLVVVRKGSPVCIGIGDGEMFIASDLSAFAGVTDKVLFMPDKSFALVQKDGVKLYDFQGNSLPIDIQKVNISWDSSEKHGFEHYMLKEIYEQKNAIHKTISFLESVDSAIWDQINLTSKQIKELETINLLGCGTSWHAARIAQFFFENICLLPTSVYLASEFRYRNFFPQTKSAYLAISQSGETADTLEAIRLINSMHLPTIALTNVASSTMVREANGFLLTHAGYEIAVASTKAFSTQLAALYWLAHRIAFEKEIISHRDMIHAQEDLFVAAEILENVIENYKLEISQTHAKKYAQYKRFIFLGRHISYPFAMEAALKLKEISYIFAQCYPAGELKHGPIALIDQETPVFIFSSLDALIYKKLLVNAQEIKARNGHLVAFVFEGQKELENLADLSFVIPTVKPLLGPLAMTGLMQYFVYQIAYTLGCPIDKPRNLAKSVTVE